MKLHFNAVPVAPIERVELGLFEFTGLRRAWLLLMAQMRQFTYARRGGRSAIAAQSRASSMPSA